ncbi:hypothetical protein PAMA_015631 [Pampus argenteus]
MSFQVFDNLVRYCGLITCHYGSLGAYQHGGRQGEEGGWEESCDAAVSHLLRSCLSRSPKDQATSLAQAGGPVLGLPSDTTRLKKHITLMCDRIGKGGRLTLASEANVQVPAQVQNLAAPGGVEPIAEVAGDGEELELSQETTKFIKKKQPTKKVKKVYLHLVTMPTVPYQNTRLQRCIRSIAPSSSLNPEQSTDIDTCSLSVTVL